MGGTIGAGRWVAAGRRRAALVTLVAVTVLGTGACQSQEADVTRPEGAVALVQNRPTPVGGFDVVASNLRSGSADVSVVDPASDEPAAGARVEVGEVVTVGGLTFEVLEVALAAQRDGAPGSDTSTAWILPD